MPTTPDCEMRIAGGGSESRDLRSDACALWQSTQVAWRLLFSTAGSAASCGLLPAGSGWPGLIKLGHERWARPARQIGAAVMAGDTILGCGSTPARRASRVEAAARVHWRCAPVARGAGILARRCRTGRHGLGGDACCVAVSVDAAVPARQRIDLALNDAVGIVAGQAHLPAGAVAHQEIPARPYPSPERADRGNWCTRRCR